MSQLVKELPVWALLGAAGAAVFSAWLFRPRRRKLVVHTRTAQPVPIRSSLYLLQAMLQRMPIADWGMEMQRLYGDAYQGAIGPFWTLAVSDADMARRVLLNPDIYEKSGVLNRWGDAFLGKNVVMVNGDVWKRQRHVMSPAFTSEAVRNLMPIFSELAQEFIAQIELTNAKADGNQQCTLRCDEWLQKVTFDALGRGAFGYSFGSMQEGDNEQVKAYKTCMRVSGSLIRLLFPIINYLPTEANRKIAEALAIMNNLVMKVIDKERESPTMTNLLGLMVSAAKADGKGSDVPNGKPQSDAMLTDKELRDNIMVFMVAGHETTAVALAYTLYELACNPEILRRCHAEMDALMPDKLVPSYDDVCKLDYLNLVIKESLRRYPPAFSLTLRRCTRDDVLGEYFVPKGTYVTVQVYNIHMHPKYWDDPQVFDPERFTADRSEHRHPAAYMPFSLGPRTCVGNSFSLLEQRTILMMILKRFEVRLPPNAPPLTFRKQSPLILNPNELNLCFVPRLLSSSS
mmetsp:Transcript_54682/g.90880  ORF Transcript_54682/g.90880 Transcript_54682/m.90880 type:complete len:515 (-) Transcript_54682:325-1869(-)